jgi:hypothetical protein
MGQERRELLAAQNRLAFCLLLLLALHSGCSAFSIPARGQVDLVAISVARSSATDNIKETVINDPERIARVIDFLNAHNSDWRAALEDPIGPYHVSFRRGGQAVFTLRIGYGTGQWIGGQEGQGKGYRYRTLPVEDWREIHKLLGVPVIERP